MKARQQFRSMFERVLKSAKLFFHTNPGEMTAALEPALLRDNTFAAASAQPLSVGSCTAVDGPMLTTPTDRTQVETTLTCTDAARLIELVWTRTVRGWCEKGRLPAHKDSAGRWVIAEKDLRDFLLRHPTLNCQAWALDHCYGENWTTGMRRERKPELDSGEADLRSGSFS